ncbi:hypothetical protein [Bacteroides finegoldii]|jgi:hypothetical protein|uniref:hypothetical protein n=1 Tax=Bacteroides finegoldii TaxID=338188 RepID=UPI0035672424
MAAKNEIPMTIEDLRNLRDSMLRYLGEYVEDLSKNHDVRPLFSALEFIMETIDDLKNV